MKIARIAIGILSLWAAVFSAFAAAEEEVTVITSDRLIYDYKQKFALFETNVVVVDPRIKITADKMTVFFNASNKVTHIKCEHHVTISQADKSARAELATYDVASGDIVLTGGKPEVWSAKNHLSGDPIIFNRDRNTVRVEGTGEKPRLVITPGQNGGSKDLMNFGLGTEEKKEKPRGNQTSP